MDKKNYKKSNYKCNHPEMYLYGRANPNYNDTKINNRTKEMKKRFLAELQNSFGFTTSASRKIGIDRTTYYRWMKEDKDFAKEVRFIQGWFDIVVEDKLKMLILNNDGPSIRYYLSRRCSKYKLNYSNQEETDESFNFIVKTIYKR